MKYKRGINNNSMLRVAHIIAEIQSCSGKNDKSKVIKSFKDDELFRKTLIYAYDPYKTYNVGKKTLGDIMEKDKIEVKRSKFETIFELLDYLTTKNMSDEVRRDIRIFLLGYDILERDLYVRMMLKDLRMGATTKTINSCIEGLIPDFGVMLAKNFDDHKHKVNGKDMILTTKLDGIRCVAIKEDDNIKFMSRSGKFIEGIVDIEKEISRLPNGYYDGELIARNDAGLNSIELYQKTKTITGKKGIKTGLEYHIFDYITLEEFKERNSKTPCHTRKYFLKELLNSRDLDCLREVEILEITNDIQVVKKHLQEAVANGQEGVMVNLACSKYKFKKTSEMLKVKQFYPFDGRILDVYEGDGKFKGMLGGVVITYKDTTVNVGGGFADKERELYWNDPSMVIGKIGECRYFEETHNEKGELDLRFCTWKQLRLDKDEVNYES